MDQLNIFEARKLRDKGIKRAADHAERVEPTWQDQAIQKLKEFPYEKFMAEEVRTFAYQTGLDPAPHDRAWGAVIQRARKEGLIKHIGYRNTSNPKSHSCPCSVWAKI